MRPAGEIRQALMRALCEHGPGTARVLAGRACTGFEPTRRTLGNMVRDAAAQVPAMARVPGVKRPVPVYALPGQHWAAACI